MNPFVLTWTLISASGIVLSVLLLIESILDLRALTGVGNGRVLHAKGRIASESIRLVIHSGFLTIGILALDSPTRASLSIFVLIGANALLILKSIIAWYIRRAAGHFGLSAAEVEAEAVETALRLRETADAAAVRLLELAARTASSVNPELQRAAERTAENTEQIARNTDPSN
jgi:hypothetical protein